VLAVAWTIQSQNGDALLLRVNDPVFRDAGSGVFATFDVKVAQAVFFPFADNLHDKIGPLGLFTKILEAAGPQKHDIRLAILSWP
jgi:hypothetical protein